MKLKIWELSLLTAFLVAILWGILLDGSQQNLAQQVIRLHIVPHSNEETHQEVKHHIRDNIQAFLQEQLEGVRGKDAAEEVVVEHLETLNQIAQETALDFGLTLPTRVSFTQERFPTRAYGHFTLPAGNYTALQIHLGDGVGQNWWCVVFPPLCFDTALGEVPDLAVMGFEEGELALIADSGGGLAFRFRVLEIFDGLRG